MTYILAFFVGIFWAHYSAIYVEKNKYNVSKRFKFIESGFRTFIMFSMAFSFLGLFSYILGAGGALCVLAIISHTGLSIYIVIPGILLILISGLYSIFGDY